MANRKRKESTHHLSARLFVTDRAGPFSLISPSNSRLERRMLRRKGRKLRRKGRTTPAKRSGETGKRDPRSGGKSRWRFRGGRTGDSGASSNSICPSICPPVLCARQTKSTSRVERGSACTMAETSRTLARKAAIPTRLMTTAFTDSSSRSTEILFVGKRQEERRGR